MRRYEVTINNKDYSVLVRKYSPEGAEMDINGKPYAIKLDGPIRTVRHSKFSTPYQGSTSEGTQAAPAAPTPIQPTVQPASQPEAAPAKQVGTAPAGAGVIRAPIPGSILEILVKTGDTVESGQTLLKMEAMKMENEINATVSGKVAAIRVKIGEAVGQGQELLEII
jgi:glutaconyl-CoA/methylmalonyl-CoA decarboxylase subunit gamma